jgi:hypothetical protein
MRLTAIAPLTVAVAVGVAVAVAVAVAFSASAAAHPILMPTLLKEARNQRGAALAQLGASKSLTLPAPPCPENGLLYPPPIQLPGVPYPLGNCGLAELPTTTLPWLGNMSYFGGHVQVHPKEYLVYWGWGEQGAFPHATCAREPVKEGSISVTLACDPDGAGRYMADFVAQMGGTKWANVSTQYYESGPNGQPQYISNDRHVLAGIWVDDTNDIRPLAKTNSSNPAGSTNTYWQLAEEAIRAAAHFRVKGSALSDANFIIAQPPAYSDPNALNSGYCAFHDYTLPGVPGNYYYSGLKRPDGSPATPLSYTNMPYALAINSGTLNDCGENAVNAGAGGKLDGFSIVLGHEIEEAITDPGAEGAVGSGLKVAYYGGWYDPLDADENGDKCAWVGEPITAILGLSTPAGLPRVLPIPGALGEITGNAGKRFAVQALWSNADNLGTGYCAGAGTDSPLKAVPYGQRP